LEHGYVVENSIVRYYKSSLNMTIIDHKMLVLGGAAYDHRGTLFWLPEASYCLLDSLNIAEFEDQKTYFFYVAALDDDSFPESSETFFQKKLTRRIHFLVSHKADEPYVFLGRLDVDYHWANAQNQTEISLPLNAFYPEKNQIDLRERKHTLGALPPEKLRELRTNIGTTVWDFADELQRVMPQKRCMKLSVLLTETVNLYTLLQSDSPSPESIYKRFEVLAKIFSWVDFTLFSSEAEKTKDEFVSLFGVRKREFFASFYYLDFQDGKSFIYQALRILSELRVLIGEANENAEDMADENRADIIPEGIFPSADLDIPEILSDKVSLEESTSTVLLENTTKQSLQVGRGRHSGNDIVLCVDDKTVSRVHLRITAYQHGFFIEDLSTMGTYIDGERIEKNVRKFVTRDHDIVLGRNRCVLDLDDPKIQSLSSGKM